MRALFKGGPMGEKGKIIKISDEFREAPIIVMADPREFKPISLLEFISNPKPAHETIKTSRYERIKEYMNGHYQGFYYKHIKD
jgi:hypothetical protein